ncbi:hypothetical protein [Roseofilum capinflatum]|uniref:Uncharacterized protein n=1 Tax=Roseofilum capinflatum BLCC-M114 TaxID=3022440 RepID=A0ABT7B5C1_9CYAN|nr:hypothetical protein [Roseofilum capinflatum]MDJ1173824.1 hypothetical protein [Roseofilum capinflatum BLCC-M114]
MTEITLPQILERLQTLEIEDLYQIEGAVAKSIAQKKPSSDHRAAFHQSLLDAGLVKQIKQPSVISTNERSLIPVKGKPVSETIIEERR